MITLYHDIEQDLDCAVDPGACVEVLERFLEIEAAAGVRVTYDVVGTLWEAQPELVERIRRAGHELAFHSYTHDHDCLEERFADEVRRCRELDASIRGYRSPRSRWTEATLDALVQWGFAWSAESDPATEPYRVREELVRLPVAMDDWPLHTGHLRPGPWRERLETALENRSYVALGFHDCATAAAADPEARLELWADTIARLQATGRPLVTFGEAARTV